jgi:hypothetical protein
MLNGEEEMTKISIELGGNRLGKWDFKNPIVAPEQVVMAFTSNIYKMENLTLMVTMKNKTLDKIYQFKAIPENNHTVDVSEAIEMGEIQVEISSYVEKNGERTKTWRVPSIICREVESDFDIIPELEFIREDIRDLNKSISELITQLKENNVLL